jgi:hypothetical protein
MLRQQSLLAFWARMDHDATLIFAKMEKYFRSSLPSYSWVRNWLRVLTRGEGISILNPVKGKASPKID